MTTPMGERRWPVGTEAKWERVLSLIDAGDCWEWTGYRDTQGYGGIWWDGRQWKAHRFIYTRLVGAIPVGLEPDHLCRNRGCVNPDHIELVTHQVNSLRSPTASSAVNARKTHCPRGHRYDGRLGSGARYCRTCARARAARYYARKKAA